MDAAVQFTRICKKTILTSEIIATKLGLRRMKIHFIVTDKPFVCISLSQLDIKQNTLLSQVVQLKK